MKHYLNLILLLFSISLSAQQQSDTLSHKHQMIDAINKGDFVAALNQMDFVNDWMFDANDENGWLDINNIQEFIKQTNTLYITSGKLDSLLMYTVAQCRTYINYCSSVGLYYIDAIPFAETSLLLIESILGDNHIDYAEALNKLATLYRELGNYKKAEQYYLKALNIYKSVLGEQHLYNASCLSNFGVLYLLVGNYNQAKQCMLQTLGIVQSVLGEQNPEYATALSTLGVIYLRQENYAQAEQCMLKALRISQSVLGKMHPEYATCLNNLGTLYYDMGDYTKTETYFHDVLTIYQSVYGNIHLSTAAAMNNLGSLYSRNRNYTQAEKYLLDAVEIRKSILGSIHFSSIESLNNIAILYRDMGDYEKALKYYLDAINAWYNSNLEKNHPALITMLINMGNICYSTGDYTNAEKCYVWAMELYKSNSDKTLPNYTTLLESIGTLYFSMGDFAKVEQYYLASADIRKSSFIESINFMSEQQRKTYWQTMQWYFTNNYTCFTYKYHIHNPSISTFAYNNELFVKGLLLNSSETVKRSILESNDTTLISQWNELTTKKQQIQVLQEKEPQSDYLKQIQEEAERLEKQITRSSAAYRENQAMWQITWDSVQNHLSSNDVAIEYFSAPLSEDSTMYCALLIRHDSEYPELIPFFEEKEISPYLSSTNTTYDFYSDGETISQLVWSKILPYIKEGETIYFAPSDLLHQLAIEYLPYDETRTMSDVYNMVRLSSTREIVLNKQDTEYTTATIYGGIAYDLEEDILLAESENYATENLLASRSIENDTLNRGNVKYLPGTKKEAESINLLLQQSNISAKLYTTAKANEESFKSLSGKHRNILHIGTHGFTWTDSVAKKQDLFAQRVQLMGQEQHYDTSIDPLNRCGLLFAGANIALQGNSKNLPEGVQDGILTAKEISLLDLRDANLVVLSACETAKGDITSEGVFGLQRAFKMAGVQTIIMSLWKVNDQATQLLMTEFYNNWIGKHQSKREAFRNAQNTVRTRYEEPEYWAGFIMLD